MIDKLYYMVLMVTICNFIELSFLLINNKNSINKKKLNIKANDTIADRILFICFCIFFCICVFMSFAVISKNNTIILCLLIHYCVLNLGNIIKSADDLKPIIINNEKRELSLKEKYQFLILASSLSCIYRFFSEKKIVSIVDTFSFPFFMKEIILTVYILLCAFCFTFILLVELVTPIKQLKKLYSKINLKYIKSKQYSAYLSNLLEEPVVKAILTNKIIYLLKEKKTIVKIISIIPVLIAFIIDFFFSIISMVYVSVIGVSIRSILYILSVLLKVLFNILFSLLYNPSQTVMYITSRLSVLFSVFLVVIYNRMNILFVPDDSFLAISEFIASTVVIPIILEWIYSNKHIK